MIGELTVEKDGVALVPNCLSDNLLNELNVAVSRSQPNTRNILAIDQISRLACSDTVKRWIAPILGEGCFAVRGILFNKNPMSNWKVAWHQDCVIAVRSRADVPGWGPWSVKAGIPHVRPPAAVLERMVTIRINLDNCGPDDGPLRVLPGSHTGGLLSDSQINAMPKDSQVVCIAIRGDAILMRPLLVHASSAARAPASRRVVHLEFAAQHLPNGLCWHTG